MGLALHHQSPVRRLLVRTSMVVVPLVVIATSLVLSAGALGSAAVAVPPVLTIDRSSNSIVLGAEKSAILRDANERLVRYRLAQERAARTAKIKALRVRIVSIARKQLGDRYSAGGAGPDHFDCSGLTRYVFRIAAGRELPHQSRAQYGRVQHISRANAQPGDLVFFFRNGAHHVGVYIGGGRMIDAAGYGKGVRVSPTSGSWWGRTYSGMGRVIPAA